MDLNIDHDALQRAIVNEVSDRLIGDDANLGDRIEQMIAKRVDAALAKNLNSYVENTLNAIMERALDTEISPVNVWGEREGKPTTIRAALHDRAKEFWQERVDKDGKKSNYGGTPRYEHVLGTLTANAFDSVVKQNIVNIAGAIKDAIRTDFYKAVDVKLNEFFKVQSIGDKPRRA